MQKSLSPGRNNEPLLHHWRRGGLAQILVSLIRCTRGILMLIASSVFGPELRLKSQSLLTSTATMGGYVLP
jgi:hypothetical protein